MSLSMSNHPGCSQFDILQNYDCLHYVILLKQLLCSSSPWTNLSSGRSSIFDVTDADSKWPPLTLSVNIPKTRFITRSVLLYLVWLSVWWIKQMSDWSSKNFMASVILLNINLFSFLSISDILLLRLTKSVGIWNFFLYSTQLLLSF